MEASIIQVQNFIVATRDSGYKSTAAALAELVDNAIESHATKIDIRIEKNTELKECGYEITVADNGHGMVGDELKLALQFGGSTRFNSRIQLGRYGMGLPNSSLSQCKRVEVYSWKSRSCVFSSYLDVEEIVENNLKYLQPVKENAICPYPITSNSGTIVAWKKCDRLSFKYVKSLAKHIQYELGRIFRYAIWKGVQIRIDDDKILPFDPLFCEVGLNLLGAIQYGEEIRYKVKVPGQSKTISNVGLRFVELPVKNWAKLSNEEKRKNQITKSAGVSIIRAGREIDYGWFFMGDKRKENYDDWWRCEISFQPELDEVFGVTHTKQEIKETEYMTSILVPDIEQTARALNNRVRLQFIDMKKELPSAYAKNQLERTDIYQPPLNTLKKYKDSLNTAHRTKGMQYEIIVKELINETFFDVEQDHNVIKLVINTGHIFYDRVFKALHDRKINNVTEFIKIIEFLMFAAARSELSFNKGKDSQAIHEFKKEWSTQLKTFIS